MSTFGPITKQLTAEKIAAFLHHDLALAELVDWAENAMMDGEFEEGEEAVLMEVVGKLGLADVRAFGLTWQDCEEALARLGYSARVEIAPLGA